MAETKTIKSPASGKTKPAAQTTQTKPAAPKPTAPAKPAAKANVEGVTRLSAWPKSVVPEVMAKANKPAQTEEEAAAKNAKNLAEQQAEAARQAAADAGSSAPSDHAPGYEAARLDAEGNPIEPEAASTEDAEAAPAKDGEPKSA